MAMSDPSRSGAQSPPPRRHARPKLRHQLLFLAGIMLLAGGAFYTALIVATQIDNIFLPGTQIHIGGPIASLPGIDSGQPAVNDVTGGRINVLVMGLDRRPTDGTAATRTDTMMVITIDPSTK